MTLGARAKIAKMRFIGHHFVHYRPFGLESIPNPFYASLEHTKEPKKASILLFHCLYAFPLLQSYRRDASYHISYVRSP